MSFKNKFTTLFILLFLFSNNIIHAQIGVIDTCVIKGNVKSFSFKRDTYESVDYQEWSNYTYQYNSKRNMTKHNRSSSFSGINYNSYYRIYDKEEELCLIQYFIQSGDTALKKIFTYNEQNDIKTIETFHQGKWGIDKISTSNYIYDKNNLLIQTNTHSIKRYFEYDTLNRLIKDTEISTNSKVIKAWEYNNEGLILTEKVLDTNWASATYNEPDKEGNWVVVKKIDYSENPKTSDSYIKEFTYNNQGQLIHEIKTKITGEVLFDEYFTYNHFGDCIHKKYYWSEKNRHIIFSYKYEYDSNRNWTKKTTKVDKELYEVEIRKIEYY